MRTTEFANKLNEIVSNLDIESNTNFIYEILLGNLNSNNTYSQLKVEITKKLNRILLVVNQYNVQKEYKKIMIYLEFDKIINEDSIVYLITTLLAKSNSHEIWTDKDAFWRIGELYFFLKQISVLNSTCQELFIAEREIETKENTKKFEFIVPHKKDGHDINEFIEILSTINSIYKDIAIIEGDVNPLLIDYIDSGSDLLIVLVGITTTIDRMMSLVKTFYEIQYMKFEKGIEHFETVDRHREWLAQKVKEGRVTKVIADERWENIKSNMMKLHGVELPEEYSADNDEKLLEGTNEVKLLNEPDNKTNNSK